MVWTGVASTLHLTWSRRGDVQLMNTWERLCLAADAPANGDVAEFEAGERQICLARIDGVLHAIDNVCPHRQGPLGQGWVEGHAVLCPWHAWAFDVTTGEAQEPERARVDVFAVRTEGDQILIKLT